MIIEFITHQTSLSLDEFVDALMKKRIVQGFPEETFVKINDLPTLSYKWTDGIHHILSIFISDKNTIQEICIIE
jgi:hypothetical protein